MINIWFECICWSTIARHSFACLPSSWPLLGILKLSETFSLGNEVHPWLNQAWTFPRELSQLPVFFYCQPSHFHVRFDNGLPTNLSSEFICGAVQIHNLGYMNNYHFIDISLWPSTHSYNAPEIFLPLSPIIGIGWGWTYPYAPSPWSDASGYTAWSAESSGKCSPQLRGD